MEISLILPTGFDTHTRKEIKSRLVFSHQQAAVLLGQHLAALPYEGRVDCVKRFGGRVEELPMQNYEKV